MDSNKSKRVVVYCRVATQAQLDGDHALEAQSARLHEQAERLGYEIVGRIARDPILWMQALRELSGKGVWIQSAAEPDAFRVDPFFHLWLPPGIQWQLALHELWKTYRRNNENSD